MDAILYAGQLLAGLGFIALQGLALWLTLVGVCKLVDLVKGDK